MDTTAIGSTIPCADGDLGPYWVGSKHKKTGSPVQGMNTADTGASASHVTEPHAHSATDVVRLQAALYK